MTKTHFLGWEMEERLPSFPVRNITFLQNFLLIEFWDSKLSQMKQQRAHNVQKEPARKAASCQGVWPLALDTGTAISEVRGSVQGMPIADIEVCQLNNPFF